MISRRTLLKLGIASLPLVGAGISGNPKRLFVGAKGSIEDSFKVPMTQVERAINTRAVTAKYTIGATFSVNVGSSAVAPIGSALWDSGKMGDTVNNRITAIEAGIYHVLVNFITGAGGVGLLGLFRYNSAGTLLDQENLGAPAVSTISFSAIFSAKYRDYFNVGLLNAGSGTWTLNQINSLAVTKIADAPSNYGI